MTAPKIIPGVLQSLKVCLCRWRIPRQIIHPLSYGVLAEHREDLGDRTPIHSLSRPTSRFYNDGRVFREFVELRVPFESIPPLLRLPCECIIKTSFR